MSISSSMVVVLQLLMYVELELSGAGLDDGVDKTDWKLRQNVEASDGGGSMMD